MGTSLLPATFQMQVISKEDKRSHRKVFRTHTNFNQSHSFEPQIHEAGCGMLL